MNRSWTDYESELTRIFNGVLLTTSKIFRNDEWIIKWSKWIKYLLKSISFQVVLLIYTVIPLPLYLCILIGAVYSILFELLNRNNAGLVESSYIKVVLHFGVHLLGIHLFILTQVEMLFYKPRLSARETCASKLDQNLVSELSQIKTTSPM